MIKELIIRKFFELMLIDSGPHDTLKYRGNSKNVHSERDGNDNKEIGSHEIEIDRGPIGTRYQTIIVGVNRRFVQDRCWASRSRLVGIKDYYNGEFDPGSG